MDSTRGVGDIGIPSRDASIRLPSGRRLAYAEWGDPDGRPVFYFHGMPHARTFFPDPEAAAEVGVRALTVDRPGVGRSDPQPAHRVGDWPADVETLADRLGLERYAVIGWSAGVAYALACAALTPERLTGVGVTTSNAALAYLIDDDPELRASWLDDGDRRILAALPRGLEAAADLVAPVAGAWAASLSVRPEEVLEGRIDRGDEWFFDDPARRGAYLRAVQEGVRQGATGVAPQWVALLAPWGFRLEEIHMPVRIWAGALDGETPPEMMGRLAERIPDHTLTVWPDVGHLGVARHLREILVQVCDLAV